MDLIVRVRTNLGQYRVNLSPTDLSLLAIKNKTENENNIKIITNFTLTPSGQEMTDDETLKLQNGDLLYCRCRINDTVNSTSIKDSQIMIKQGEIVEVNKSRKTKASTSLSPTITNKIRALNRVLDADKEIIYKDDDDYQYEEYRDQRFITIDKLLDELMPPVPSSDESRPSNERPLLLPDGSGPSSSLVPSIENNRLFNTLHGLVDMINDDKDDDDNKYKEYRDQRCITIDKLLELTSSDESGPSNVQPLPLADGSGPSPSLVPSIENNRLFNTLHDLVEVYNHLLDDDKYDECELECELQQIFNKKR